MEPGVELGYTEADFGKAMATTSAFDCNQSIRDAADALKVLRARPECKKARSARSSFCLGGKLAYLAKRRRHRLRRQLLWRRHRGDLAEAHNIKGPMVSISRSSIASRRQRRRASQGGFKGRSDVEFYLYPGCGHACCGTGAIEL